MRKEKWERRKGEKENFAIKREQRQVKLDSGEREQSQDRKAGLKENFAIKREHGRDAERPKDQQPNTIWRTLHAASLLVKYSQQL